MGKRLNKKEEPKFLSIRSKAVSSFAYECLWAFMGMELNH